MREEKQLEEEKEDEGRAWSLKIERLYDQSVAEGWKEQTMGATLIMES